MATVAGESRSGEAEAVAEGPVPKHARLRSILLDRIGTVWPAHTAIPSERELTATHGVSRATVRETIGRLVADGVLVRVHGRGTFVAGPRVQTTLHLASFSQDVRRRGLAPSTVVRRADLVAAPDEVRSALGLDDGDRAWRLDRLRLADGEPMALEVGWYAAATAPDLGSRDLTGSVYELLALTYGARIDSAEQTVWAEAAGADVAAPLGVGVGAALLVFRRTSSAAGRPVEHVTSWYRGDRYQVRTSLTSS